MQVSWRRNSRTSQGRTEQTEVVPKFSGCDLKKVDSDPQSECHNEAVERVNSAWASLYLKRTPKMDASSLFICLFGGHTRQC